LRLLCAAWIKWNKGCGEICCGLCHSMPSLSAYLRHDVGNTPFSADF
jgi:hypothetical protein